MKHRVSFSSVGWTPLTDTTDKRWSLTLRVRIRVSGWLVVTHTHLYHFQLLLSLSLFIATAFRVVFCGDWSIEIWVDSGQLYSEIAERHGERDNNLHQSQAAAHVCLGISASGSVGKQLIDLGAEIIGWYRLLSPWALFRLNVFLAA